MSNNGEYQCKFCTGDAWNRVIEQAGEFSRKEAAMWTSSNNQYRRIAELEKKVLDMTSTIDDNVSPSNVTSVTDLRSITGGKGGGGRDWLSPLPVGTRFLARPLNPPKKTAQDNSDFLLTMYQVVWVGNKARQLLVHINMFAERPDETIVIAVDPAMFCKQHGLFEAIEGIDEQRYWTDPDRGLENDEPAGEQLEELPAKE